MSLVFEADWLALREPADHAARDPVLTSALAQALAARDRPIRIVDLGCGAGSNLRALAPHLAPVQSWRLVDHDPALLARARETLTAWAETASTVGDDLFLTQGQSRIAVSFLEADLAADLSSALGEAPDLVTAAALFDLVSAAAIERIVDEVAARGALFHTALSYDGQEEWQPPHAADAAMQAAFLHHLSQDKGLGPAAGVRATDLLAEAFRRRDYEVRTAPSLWRLGSGEDALRRALAAGKAAAVSETGLVPAADVESWRAHRAEDGMAAIGHSDLLALPLRSAA